LAGKGVDVQAEFKVMEANPNSKAQMSKDEAGGAERKMVGSLGHDTQLKKIGVEFMSRNLCHCEEPGG
jgi:hypothetical protein